MPHALLLRFPDDWREPLDNARGDDELAFFIRELILDRIGRNGLTPNFTRGQGGGRPAWKPKKGRKKAAPKKLSGKRK
jgi:hypothetical protein